MVMITNTLWQSMLSYNSSTAYLQATILFVLLFIAFKVFDLFIIAILKRGSKRSKNNFDDVIVGFLEKISWVFYLFLAVYLSANRLVLPRVVDKTLNYLLVIFIAFYAAKGLINIIHYILEGYKARSLNKGHAVSESMMSVLLLMTKIIIWAIALLMVLSNFGIEITPLIAGLGVGGIAIGLALQTILGDLFSAFAIYFDKPFEEGDFIIIGDDMGVVKHIGIKSTRITALGGQELVMSNSELTSSRVNNYKRMNTRRVVFHFGVEYKTTPSQLRKIKKIAEGIINEDKHATLDRVHFHKFGDSSLDFEVVYYVDSNDYAVYMDTQERINLALKEKIEKAGVDFAFPSRTIYTKKG